MPPDRLDLASFFRITLLLCAVGQTVACTRPTPPQRVGTMAAVLPLQPDLCGLIRLNRLIGQNFVQLADQPLVGTLRVVWPGQEITSNVVPTRLNAQVNDEGLILGLSCG